MTDPNEIIQVMIEVTQKVTYSRIQEMKRSEFEEADAKLDAGMHWREEAALADKYMDYDRDWTDSDDTEITDFRIYKEE